MHSCFDRMLLSLGELATRQIVGDNVLVYLDDTCVFNAFRDEAEVDNHGLYRIRSSSCKRTGKVRPPWGSETSERISMKRGIYN